VLKGSILFMADLIRALPIAHSIDFLATSSYGAATESTALCASSRISMTPSRIKMY